MSGRDLQPFPPAQFLHIMKDMEHGQRGRLDTEALDRAVGDVAARRDDWQKVGPGARADLLHRCMAATAGVAGEWAEADAAQRHVSLDSPYVGLEWLAGPNFVLRTMRLYAQTMRDVARFGAPRPPGPVRVRPDGRLSVGIWPSGYDRLIFPGYSAQTWLPAGTPPSALDEQMAGTYRDGRGAGTVRVVLGAGNVSSLAPNDVLTALFVHSQTVVLKLSPVLTYLEPTLTRAFAPLIQAGVLRVVTGSQDVAAYLAHHRLVDSVLLTGSPSTYDALVFGTGTEGAQRKAEDRPVLDKPVLAELGSVTPVIVVPGPWSTSDIRYHAETVASALVANAGATCVTPKVLVTHRQWPLRKTFLDALRQALSLMPTRYPYYPGTDEKYAAFVQAHPQAERLGTPAEDHLPWILQTGLDPGDAHEPAFVTDPFCGILSETALDVPGSPADFLSRATAFTNERLFGSLNAVVLVDPRTRRDRETGPALQRALTELRYGNVVVNSEPGLPYLGVASPWGAYPGQPRNRLLSGMGFVHNTYLFDDPEKTVTWAPFRVRPKPPWLFSHRRSLPTWRADAEYEATGSLRSAAKVLWYGARS